MTTPLILLSDMREHLNSTSIKEVVENRLRRVIEEESAHLQRLCHRRFDEYIETEYYDAYRYENGGDIDGRELVLNADLKSTLTVTNGDGSVVTPTALPKAGYPKYRLRLDVMGNTHWTAGINDPIGAIAVHGVWGYGGEWVTTTAALATDINSSVTTLTSSNTTGINVLEAGMLLKVDSEYLLVTQAVGSQATVKRGYNGSTTAAHTTGATLSQFIPDSQVQSLVRRLVMWRLEQDKAPLLGQAIVGDMAYPVKMDSVPKDVMAAIEYAGLRRVVESGQAV